MAGDEEVHQRNGGQPHVAQTPANADGRVVVGSGAPQQDAEALRQQMIDDRKQELREIDEELSALNREVGSNRPNAEQIEYGTNLQADAYIAATELNALENHSYAESFEDFIETNGSMQGSLDNMTGPQRLHMARGQSDDFLARASGWDIIEVGPQDLLGGPGGWLGRRGRKLFGRWRRPRGRLGGNRTRAQERVRGRRRKRRERKECRLAGNPAFMPTGIPVHYDPDFSIPGLLKLAITSTWYGDVEASGPLGRGRLSDIDATISRNEAKGFTLLDEDGFAVNFKAPTPIPDGWEEGDTVRNTSLMQGHGRALILKEDALETHFAKGRDGIWRIGQIKDRRGNALQFARDAAENLLSITTPEGLKILFSYEGSLRMLAELEGVDGSRKTVMRYRYDEKQRMVLAECSYGERHEFAYDDWGMLSEVIRNGHYHAKFEHDEKGRRTRTVSNLGVSATFQYDEVNRITTYMPGSDRHRAIQFHYDENGAIIREVNALGHEKRFVTDDEGRIAAEIDGEGNETRYAYDAAGNVKSIRDPVGRSTYYGWTSEGDMELVIDNAGKAWDFHYDDFGALSLVKSPVGHISEIRNNAAGLPTGVLRHDGLIAQNAYDGHNWLTETLDFRNARTRFERDAFGRVVRMTEANGASTTYEYEDQSGHNFFRPTRIIRPDGAVFSSYTSENGRLLETVDGEGRRSRYEYDGLGNLVLSVTPLGGRIGFHYDDELNLMKVVNEAGREWTFVRDVGGRIVQETDFSGRTTDYALDRADRVVEAKQPDGRVLAYERDASGSIVSRSAFLPGETKALQRETFAYDDVGRLNLASNAHVTISLEYDAAGQPISETTNGIRIESEYDCCGNRVKRRIGDQVVTYDYDPLGALTGVSLGERSVLNVIRDRLGQPVRRTTPEGFVIEFVHDPLGQLVRQTASSRVQAGRQRSTPLPEIWSRQFEWDRSAAPTMVADPLWGTSCYEMDGNGQVTAAWHGGPNPGAPVLATVPADAIAGIGGDNREVERFDYAPTQDIAASETALPDHPLGRPLRQWSHATGGEVLEAFGPHGEQIRYEYDAAGRVSDRHVDRNGFRRQSFHYLWDGFDQLIGVECPDGSAWRYSYDPFGRRIEKQQVRAARRQGRNGGATLSVHRFLWDGDVLAVEHRIADASEDRQSFVWWHFEPDSFVPMLRVDINASGEQRILHVVTDHLGAPRELVRPSGEVVWSSSYRLWGGIRGLWTAANDNRGAVSGGAVSRGFGSVQALLVNVADTEPGGDDQAGISAHTAVIDADLCPIRFLGQWEDAETGLCYNRFRTYDPSTGQYLSPDPIGLLGGLRTHGYVEIPTWWADPLGLYGVYVFQMQPGRRCYVGKGEPTRMAESMRYRTGSSTREQGRNRCPRRLYTNTDADAAAAGMNPRDYGALVENRLLSQSGFNAVADSNWANVKLDGQSVFNRATPAQRAAATLTATRIRTAFGRC